MLIFINVIDAAVVVIDYRCSLTTDVDVIDADVVHLIFRVLLVVYFRGPVVGGT